MDSNHLIEQAIRGEKAEKGGRKLPTLRPSFDNRFPPYLSLAAPVSFHWPFFSDLQIRPTAGADVPSPWVGFFRSGFHQLLFPAIGQCLDNVWTMFLSLHRYRVCYGIHYIARELIFSMTKAVIDITGVSLVICTNKPARVCTCVCF